MGYQPGLDGLRAVSVVAVIAYHAHALGAGGFGAARGGFLGRRAVLRGLGLPDHVAPAGGVDPLRRHLPGPVLDAPGPAPAPGPGHPAGGRAGAGGHVAHRHAGPAAHRPARRGLLRVELGPGLRRGGLLRRRGRPPAAPPPLVARRRGAVVPAVAAGVIALMRTFGGNARRIRLPIVAGAVASVVAMQVLYRSGDADRTNLVYLATFTRAGGLLIGAALATRGRRGDGRTPAAATWLASTPSASSPSPGSPPRWWGCRTRRRSCTGAG